MYKGRQMKSICYCCSNSVDNKPRTNIEGRVSLLEQNFISLKEREDTMINNVTTKELPHPPYSPPRPFKKQATTKQLSEFYETFYFDNSDRK